MAYIANEELLLSTGVAVQEVATGCAENQRSDGGHGEKIEPQMPLILQKDRTWYLVDLGAPGSFVGLPTVLCFTFVLFRRC